MSTTSSELTTMHPPVDSSPPRDLHAIACENCRVKKCKCDRTLCVDPAYTSMSAKCRRPSCSQCQSASVPCRYQAGGRRGLPAAYINSLENRLVETEAALSAALLVIHDQSCLHLVDRQLREGAVMPPAKDRSKAGKQDEWKGQPLRSGGELMAWLRLKHRGALPTEAERLRPPTAAPSSVQKTSLEQGHIASRTAISMEPSAVTAISTESAIAKLKTCSPPSAPNLCRGRYATRWRDNYF
jgi:hypothetical protein